MAAGDFTPTKLAEVQLKMMEMWKEPQFQKNYVPRGDTTKTVLDQQTATFEALEDPDKLKEVAVHWADFCGDTAVDSTNVDDCPLDACIEGEGKSKSYALDVFIDDCFSVTEEDLETSTLSIEEVVAMGMAAKQKNIAERFNAKVLAVIGSGAGDNPYLNGYTDNAGVTEIPEEDWTIEKIFPYWVRVMTMNRSTSVFALDGGNLFEEYIRALTIYQNDNGKQPKNLLDMISYGQDMFGFTRNDTTDETYLIDRGAVAIANRAKFPSNPRLVGGLVQQTRYSIPMVNEPRLKIDVIYGIVCTGDEIKHTWKMKLRAGVFLNPTMCDAGNTGILTFRKVGGGQP